MKVSFKIDYQTQWGQILYVTGSGAALGQWDVEKAIRMENIFPGEWELKLDFEPDDMLVYKYFLKEASGGVIWEWGDNRCVDLNRRPFEELRLRDFWRTDTLLDNAMMSSAFTSVLLRRDTPEAPVVVTTKKVLRMQVNVPRIDPRYVVAILGSESVFGNWKESDALLMSDANYPLWHVELDADLITFPFQYKFVIYDKDSRSVVTWEDGNNRVIRDFICAGEPACKVHTDIRFRFPAGTWKGAGVAVPLFSLRTDDSGGIGEFLDLKKMVDWARSVSLKMLQILPVNETVCTHSWIDSYPYKAISVRALHPVYMHIEALGRCNDVAFYTSIKRELMDLNEMEVVHYEDVHKVKSRYFKHMFNQDGEELLKADDFRLFFEENCDWLIPYAAFCYLRDRFKTADFAQWGEYAQFNRKQIETLCAPESEVYPDIAVHYYIQYHLHCQLSDVAAYARANRIVLKGDIPIGIGAKSLDAWMEPQLFNLGQQAGAPPDDFSDEGQNWGFPTYNWEEMAKDNYAWWRKRLSAMSQYFDAYRIDHILGFFRIWEIPSQHVLGYMGHFRPALSVSREELLNRGIWFEEKRFCKPYIREYFLWEYFGEFTEEVKEKYLTEYKQGAYRLLAEVDSQRKIWETFDERVCEEDGKLCRIRDGLMALAGDVVFLQDELRADHFHLRIGMNETNSYQNLDEITRHRLDDLYIDFFYKRHDDFWRDEGLKKLPALVAASKMLVCGEDLGMIPDCVPDVMKSLGILSLEIQRMPKDLQIEFAHPGDAHYLSVCSTSTHDMSTMRGWWEEDREKSARFFHSELGHKGDAPYFMEPWIARDVINQHMWSPAMWVVFPIQDLMAIDGELRWDKTWGERVNVPAVAQHYWRYRMHVKLETLIDEELFNRALNELVKASGRY